VNKRQLGILLGAATITGLVLVMLLLLGGPDTAAGADPTTVATADSTSAQVVPLESYKRLQAENAQLRQNLQIMLMREAQYQSQLNLANQMLQRQGQSIPFGQQNFGDEGFENEAFEHEGRES
jgi:hypothetical protein